MSEQGPILLSFCSHLYLRTSQVDTQYLILRKRQPNEMLFCCMGAVLVLYFNSLTFKNCYVAEK